jgi:hypothetical protein
MEASETQISTASWKQVKLKLAGGMEASETQIISA